MTSPAFKLPPAPAPVCLVLLLPIWDFQTLCFQVPAFKRKVINEFETIWRRSRLNRTSAPSLSGGLWACCLMPPSLSFCTCIMDMLMTFCSLPSASVEDSVLLSLASARCSQPSLPCIWFAQTTYLHYADFSLAITPTPAFLLCISRVPPPTSTNTWGLMAFPPPSCLCTHCSFSLDRFPILIAA